MLTESSLLECSEWLLDESWLSLWCSPYASDVLVDEDDEEEDEDSFLDVWWYSVGGSDGSGGGRSSGPLTWIPRPMLPAWNTLLASLPPAVASSDSELWSDAERCVDITEEHATACH